MKSSRTAASIITHSNYETKKQESYLLILIEIHTLELKKLPEYTDNTRKYGWLQFLKAEKEDEFMVAAKENPIIEKAYAELKRLSADEQAQRLAEDREKALRDENARNKYAFNKGIAEGVSSVARKAIQMNLPIGDIIKLTGLTYEEVECLRNTTD